MDVCKNAITELKKQKISKYSIKKLKEALQNNSNFNIIHETLKEEFMTIQNKNEIQMNYLDKRVKEYKDNHLSYLNIMFLILV